ncbi:MAG: dihydroxyacetone kinase phosphoryl donor subunit DhaM, partial [Agrococcus sp.]
MSVGLVIVSHSARIAEGVVELAAQMAPSVVIVAAGGTDDGGIGTSFDRVQAALGEAESGDGVVVLCDLGSAVLTAETAVDFSDAPERIRIADAPIVEGAVAAAVAAEAGDDL